jgi:hypothetical protein
MVQLHQMAQGIGLDVWGAIREFHALATAIPPANLVQPTRRIG